MAGDIAMDIVFGVLVFAVVHTALVADSQKRIGVIPIFISGIGVD